MVVRTPIFGIAAVALLPRKDNTKYVIASEAWRFPQFYRHIDP